MKLEEIIAGYVDLARQAVAYRKATESDEEIRGKSWKVLAGSITGSEEILAYIAESDPSVTTARFGRVEVSLFSGKISLPYSLGGMGTLEDRLVSARKKMLEIVLMQSIDAEGGEA